jgi:NCAIR mutase (PurE)-related protein
MLQDAALEDFLGADGLTDLLELLSRGELPQEQVVEMIKRLHTPGYERARFHVEAAAREGIIEPNMAPGFYSQQDIIRVVEWADAQGLKP